MSPVNYLCFQLFSNLSSFGTDMFLTLLESYRHYLPTNEYIHQLDILSNQMFWIHAPEIGVPFCVCFRFLLLISCPAHSFRWHVFSLHSDLIIYGLIQGCEPIQISSKSPNMFPRNISGIVGKEFCAFWKTWFLRWLKSVALNLGFWLCSKYLPGLYLRWNSLHHFWQID